MTRFLFLSACLAAGGVLNGPLTVLAQDAAEELPEAPEPPAIPPGDDVIHMLNAGDRAPVRGALFDTDTSIRWGNRLEWFRHELRLTLRDNERNLRAVRESSETQLRITRESYEREIQGLRDDIRAQAQTFAEASSQPFYDTFTFGLIIGLVAAGVLVGLVAWIGI